MGVEQGGVVIAAGSADFPEVFVLLSGSASMQDPSGNYVRLKQYTMMGRKAMLFHHQATTIIADTFVELLVLKRSLLENMFGDELPLMLVMSRVRDLLAQHSVFGAHNEEQREVLARSCEIRSLEHDAELDVDNICFGAVLHGDVDAEVYASTHSCQEVHRASSGIKPARRHSGLANATFGEKLGAP